MTHVEGGGVEINMAYEVLGVLPRTAKIDGIEIMRKVKISIKLKVEAAAKKMAAETVAKDPSLMLVGFEHKIETGSQLLNYDTVIEILTMFERIKMVSKTNAEPLPLFQRID